jgi:putative hydrolase of the HAD superfamily
MATLDVPSGHVVLWDFDGTLAYRPGEWRGCLIEVLDELAPGHGLSTEQVRPYLRGRFPWHRPDVPHPQLSDPDRWWSPVETLLGAALQANGVTESVSQAAAHAFRQRYADGSIGWRQVEGATDVLTRLGEQGWRHIVVSNHVPELAQIVHGTGLGPWIDAVVSSAVVGYEKPHPGIFAVAREITGDTAQVWMVGDNPDADVAGAVAAGIPALLVQHPGRPPQEGAISLHQAADLILRRATQTKARPHPR